MKPESEKFVIVGGKVSPQTRASIERIAGENNWSISTAVRVACDMLIQYQAAIKNHPVNENVLTS